MKSQSSYTSNNKQKYNEIQKNSSKLAILPSLSCVRAFLLKICRKPIHSRLCHLFLVIFEGQQDHEAQVFKPSDGPTLGRLGDLFVGMTRTQFAVGLLLLEQVINDDQDPVCQCHVGFLAAHALCQSFVVGPQVGILAMRGPVGRLDEGLLQPTIALARLGAQPFAGADFGLRAQSHPADLVTTVTSTVGTGGYTG